MRSIIVATTLTMGAVLVGCTSAPASDNVDSSETMVIGGVEQVVRRPDGRFDVICKGKNGGPNYNEIVTEADVLSDSVCSASPSAKDPFEPTSCSGQPMTVAEALGRFQPGASTTQLGEFTILERRRTCSSKTGCGAWSATETMLVGTASLYVTDGGANIRLALGGKAPEGSCKEQFGTKTCSPIDGGPTTCRDFALGASLRTSITCPTCSKECWMDWLQSNLTGTVGASCTRLEGSKVISKDPATGSEVVSEMVLLSTY